MIGTLVLTALLAGPQEPAREAQPATSLQLDFETRLDAPVRTRDGRGAGGSADSGHKTTQTNGLHPGSGSLGPPTGSNLPPEAGPGPAYPRFLVIRIGGFAKGTQTGYAEEFMLYAPAPSKPRPLLVVFHKYGVGWRDAIDNTAFFEEGIRRKWHVMCQLGASGVHLSSFESQQNTEVALQWVFDNFNIDKSRIYGVGFSMGGGAVANYAARHTDPKEHMFAAIVDHTGMMSHNDTYANSPQTQFVFEFWFGGAPPDPFLMARSSLIDFDPQTLAVDTTTDVARNLTHVPIRVMRASNEPPATAYLTTQNDVFYQHMLSMNGNILQEIVPYSGHSWAMLDEQAVCSWLANWTLRTPKNADTLADHDGTYFFFDVVQDAPGAFTPFSWSINETQNKVLVWKTSNLQRLAVDVLGAGLSTSQTLQVVLQADDGLADECRLGGYASAPTEVRRDGLVQAPGSTWSHDPVLQQVWLQEWDPQTHIWEIDP